MNHGELTGIYDRLDQIETRQVKTVSHRPRRDLYFWPLAVALLASLAAHAWKLWAGRAAAPTARSTPRLRVNARTFELEAIEQ
jgi:Ca-activated chloride channel family protein